MRDYVELRGLNGLSSDVTKWSQPPSPAAFLDAGLPKTGGAGSLPRGLSAIRLRRPLRRRFRESQQSEEGEGDFNKGNDCNESVDSRPQQHCHLPPGTRRKKSSFDSIISNCSSIPSPTWEAEGPEGFVSQVQTQCFRLSKYLRATSL